ncbi:MAG: thioredoxin family protein [Chitinophagaceae bacterium]
MKNWEWIFFVLFISFFISSDAQENVYPKIYASSHKQNIYEGLLSSFNNHEFHEKKCFFDEILIEKCLANMKIYKPLVNALIKANEQINISMIIVGGIWWCSDTRDILSKLVIYTDTDQFNKITCIGVDRKKQSHSYPVVNQYDIERVPTIILFKNNQEISRVIEYAKKEIGKKR